MKKIDAVVVMHKRTGELKECTNSWFGPIIWMQDYDSIPENSLAGWPYIIYDDDKRFKDYTLLGEL